MIVESYSRENRLDFLYGMAHIFEKESGILFVPITVHVPYGITYDQ